MSWRRLRQEGFLTVAIVMAATVMLDMLAPSLSLRGELLTIAILALLMGWVP